MVRSLFFVRGCSFAYPFCEILSNTLGVFLARIPGYTQGNDHFLSVYSFIRSIRGTNTTALLTIENFFETEF